jgi:tRNA A-37 threonylcarbamoyl transferase component Bud32
MDLPRRTSAEDIDQICNYLATKPAGASFAEAKAVLGEPRVDPRKLAALKYWGLLADSSDDRLVLSPTGRELAKGSTWKAVVLASVVRNVPPYLAIIERAYHKKEPFVSITDVGAHWFEHFRSDVSESEELLKEQVLTFFHVASGAQLGNLVLGRRNSPTRLEINADNVAAFVHSRTPSLTVASTAEQVKGRERGAANPPPVPRVEPEVSVAPLRKGDGSFLQRGLEVDCYRLNRRLGSGFSAEVWSAHVIRPPIGVELEVDQEVAIKFYTANALAIPDQVIRVEREYRVAQRMRHPHLIRIYEFVLASPRPHHNFLVMDVAPGPPLSTVITANKIELTNALRIVAQILSGAEALHEAGALHRDIKPGNISYSTKNDGSPHCVLLDLGIVSPMFEKGVTAVSRFVGSKHWAPLEQLVGGTLDQRSDLYSIGALAYNLLVGVEPFSGSATEAAVAVEMSRGGLKIPDLATLPSEITEVFNACLSNKQGERPRSAQEVLSVLRRHEVEP